MNLINSIAIFVFITDDYFLDLNLQEIQDISNCFIYYFIYFIKNILTLNAEFHKYDNK